MTRLILLTLLAIACSFPATAQLQARVVIDSPPDTIPSRAGYPATVFFHIYTPPPPASAPAPLYLIQYRITCVDGLEITGSYDVDSAKARWQGWSQNIPSPRTVKSVSLTARIIAGDEPITVTTVPPAP